MANNNENKILNVPNLRFPEFSGEWKKMKVSELLDFYSTNSLSWEQLDYNNGKIKNLHYGLIHKGVPTMVDVACDYLPYIKEESMPKSFTLFKEGDVAFADASEDTNDVAKAIEVVNCDNQQIVSGLHTIHGRDNSNQTIIGYKGYAFASDSFHKQIRRIAQGTKVFSISTRNFDEVYIGIPSKEEQTKIAKLLIAIDKRIATQNKIIDKLQSLIKGLVVAHYSTTRHTSKVKIRDLGEAYSTMAMSKEQLSEDGNPCIFYGELFTIYGCVVGEVKSRTDLQKGSATLSCGRDLLFPASTTVDALSLIAPSALMEKDIILGGDMFGIKISQAFNPLYLSYYFNYVANKRLSKYAKGTTIIHLHYNEIANVAVELPSIEEQDKIVTTVQGYSTKLTIEGTLLKRLSDLKLYLLSQMFI